MYVPLSLLNPKPSHFILDHLKESLSQTLSHFYHFGGRYKDARTLECNDSAINPLQTRNIYSSQSSPNDQPLVAIQVNKFSCGGICITSSIHHFLGDASSLSLFLNAWARISRAEEDKENVLKDFIIIDTSSIFNPIDVHDVQKSTIDSNAIFNPVGTRVKRFIFDNPKIQALVKSASRDNKESPTRMEALCSFLWAAIQRNSAIKKHVLYSAVNLRKKMNPPLPANIIGNIGHLVSTLTESNECSTDYKFLLPKLQKSFRMAYEDFVDKTKDGGIKYLAGGFSNIRETLAKYEIEQIGLFGMSSWCRFNFYDIDFARKPNYDYSGIEVMLSLLEGRNGETLEEKQGVSLLMLH
ncbi:hypothetical protein Leryth_019240 [Lithospermum erythrorhizon]|nr:hypothetical protein Leryth_019240 [Lithospermum erythrorhizon]